MEIITINEGQVKIDIPVFNKVSSKAPVFYNPVMEFNRDISVLALQAYRNKQREDIRICDAFGGSGIRGIRYAAELNGVMNVVINDLNPLAVQFIQSNILKNGLSNVEACKKDANILLHSCRGKFHVVDIDPFGTPSPYIESAAVSLKAGGMLCVTATDTSALCGTYKEPCIRKYGAMPLKSEYCHEVGLRILAGFISRTFAKYKKYTTPLFSHSSEHYLRLYLEVGKGAGKTDKSLKNLGFIVHCPHCLYREVRPGITPQLPSECPECGGSLKAGGPLWLGDLLDTDYIGDMLNLLPKLTLNSDKKVIKLLERCYEESQGPVTFYDLHKICKVLKISAPPLNDVLEKLSSEGYFASRTHIKPTGIKTNAPIDELKKIILLIKQ
ncbi:MAG: tRNA (guanine(26)-N(2))-dimethyltransferase [Methanobacterium sp.]|nr:tRNA (guanine(26)-N(2))-dimethyltransferase [Methanobacterium sp.]